MENAFGILIVTLVLLVPFVCAVMLALYRYRPRAAWYPYLLASWWVVIAGATAALAFLLYRYFYVDPNDKWARYFTVILALDFSPLFIAAVLAFFLKPSPPQQR